MQTLVFVLFGWLTANLAYSNGFCREEVKVQKLSVSSTKDSKRKDYLIDDNEATYWESHGHFEWIEMDLGDVYSIGSIDLTFPKDKRERYIFLIQLSVDSRKWASVRMAQANPQGNHRQTFDFSDYRARFIRIQTKGNTFHNKNRIAEIKINGGDCDAPLPFLDEDENPWDEYVPEILSNISSPQFPDRECKIDQYGAREGNHDSKGAIQKAIEDCHRRGGGKVIVPEGTFFSKGPIHLQSNINLHLDEGAKIEFSTDPHQYLPVVYSNWEGSELYNYSSMIYAKGKTNIAITGKGRIDGQASKDNWWRWKDKQDDDVKKLRSYMHRNIPAEQRRFGEDHYLRPPLILIIRSKNILIEGVELRGSPFWFINPVLSENIIVRDVDIDGKGPNNDGVNPVSSLNVLIEDNRFDTGDDCIAIKSGRDNDAWRLGVPSENVIIRNNRMEDGHGGIVIGSEISGGVRNVFATDNEMSSPNLERALRFKSNSDRGGFVDNIHIKDTKIGRVGRSVIHFETSYSSALQDDYPTIFSNIVLKEIECEEAGSREAIYIEGNENFEIENLILDDIEIHNSDKEARIRNVKNLKVSDVKINGRRFNP